MTLNRQLGNRWLSLTGQLRLEAFQLIVSDTGNAPCLNQLIKR